MMTPETMTPELTLPKPDAAKWLDKKISVKSALILMSVILIGIIIAKLGPILPTSQGHGGPEVVVTSVKMDGIVVNLHEEEEMHYLKTSMELEASDVKQIEKIQAKIPSLRHETILFLSSLAVADTQGEKSKIDVQSKLVARLNKVLAADLIGNVFFTEFVVQ